MKILKFIFPIMLVVLVSCESPNKKYPELEEGLYAEIETNAGDLLLKLAFEDVPVTVGNFVSLAEGENDRVIGSLKGKPFYDGLNFHRIMSKVNGDPDDFMIQGGCPLGTGSGDPGYKFADEFAKDENGELLFKHDKPGVLSMANSGPGGTNGSQFFITLSPQSHLDGVHSVFGSLVKGQELAFNLKVGTVISKVNIIRVGRAARNFEAFEALDESFNVAEAAAEDEQEQMKKTIAKYAEIEKKATELTPDFKIFFTKKGEGPKPELESSIRISYSVFFTDGKLLDSNDRELARELGVYDEQKDAQDGYEPFRSTYSMNERLIQGFKEGLQEMQFGDKVVLFIPYHLAYGEQGGRGIPPKSDLIFELEMFPLN